jgi:hypothetical protein
MFDLGLDDTTESSLPLEIRSPNFEIRNKFKILISKSPNRDKPEPNRKNSPQRRRGRGGRRDFLFFQMQHSTSDSAFEIGDVHRASSQLALAVYLLCALCVSAVNFLTVLAKI